MIFLFAPSVFGFICIYPRLPRRRGAYFYYFSLFVGSVGIPIVFAPVKPNPPPNPGSVLVGGRGNSPNSGTLIFTILLVPLVFYALKTKPELRPRTRIRRNAAHSPIAELYFAPFIFSPLVFTPLKRNPSPRPEIVLCGGIAFA